MTDNFNKIKELLNWDNPDLFYYIQILRRKKENPDARSVKEIDNIYVQNLDYFVRKEKYIRDMCDYFNARAYIRLNRRSWRDVSLLSMEMLAKRIRSEQYEQVNSIFSKACGNTHSEDPKLWVIDIDDEDLKVGSKHTEITEILWYIDYLHRQIDRKDYKRIAEIKTPNGRHIITHPFNSKLFSEKFPHVSIHRDNPTVLYVP